MKKAFKLFGIIALLAVIGFSMAACDNGTTDAEGTFTITNIPAEYNGKYASFIAYTSSKEIWGVQFTESDLMALTKISNGKAVIPLLDGNTGDTYKGNDTFVTADKQGEVGVLIFETATVASLDGAIVYALFASVKFSKGSASKSWNDRIKN